MQTRSIDAKPAHRPIGRAVAVMMVVTLAACNAVQAQQAADVQPGAATVVATLQPNDPSYLGLERASGKPAGLLEDETPQSSSDSSQSTDTTIDQAIGSMTVSASLPRSEPWDGFRRSVATAATSSCFGPDALPHEEFAVEGLLRLPFLAHAAATSACR